MEPFARWRSECVSFEYIAVDNHAAMEVTTFHPGHGRVGIHLKLNGRFFPDLLRRMLSVDPANRPTIEEIKTDPWYNMYVLVKGHSCMLEPR